MYWETLRYAAAGPAPRASSFAFVAGDYQGAVGCRCGADRAAGFAAVITVISPTAAGPTAWGSGVRHDLPRSSRCVLGWRVSDMAKPVLWDRGSDPGSPCRARDPAAPLRRALPWCGS